MGRSILVRHFVTELVEPDLSPEHDRHQVIAGAAAGVITIPLFAAVLMGWRYLVRPLSSPGWTATAALVDAVVFTAASMFVAGGVALLEWDALALKPRDWVILGVLPLSRRHVLTAKLEAIGRFCLAFVVALSAVTTIVHPPLIAAGLPLSVTGGLALMAGHGLTSVLAGLFGFWCVVGIRECLYFASGPRVFSAISELVRSSLLFGLLLALAFLPLWAPSATEWMLRTRTSPAVVRPITWFASIHAAVTGHIIEQLPTPDLPPPFAEQEEALRHRYRTALPAFLGSAGRGVVALVVILGISCGLFFANARRVTTHESASRWGRWSPLRLVESIIALAIRRPAVRAGFLFLLRTSSRSNLHRAYVTCGLATGIVLFVAFAPARGTTDMPRVSTAAAQTWLLTGLFCGVRAALRKSASTGADWSCVVADVGSGREFSNGMRLAGIVIVAMAVLAVVPVHAAAWGVRASVIHAVNGLLIGCVLIEMAFIDTARPLIWSVPPTEGLNTMGMVWLGLLLACVLVLARIECAAMQASHLAVLFAAATGAGAFALARQQNA